MYLEILSLKKLKYILKKLLPSNSKWTKGLTKTCISRLKIRSLSDCIILNIIDKEHY